MKRLSTFLLALVLVFSLVACGKTNTTDKDSKKETKTETKSEADKKAEKEKRKAEKKIVTFAINEDTVILQAEGVEPKIYKNSEKGLMPGHKYEFKADPKTLEGKDKLDIKPVNLSGKAVGFSVSPKILEEVKKLMDVKFVDTRDAAKFAEKNIEGSINLTKDQVAKWFEKGAEKPVIEGITKDTVIAVVGEDPAANAKVAEAIYKVFKVNRTLNAGKVEDYLK